MITRETYFEILSLEMIFKIKAFLLSNAIESVLFKTVRFNHVFKWAYR